MLALRLGSDGELTSWRPAEILEGIEFGLRRLRIRERQLAARHLEVLHEVAADEIVGVAESGADLAVGGEQEACILDGVTREHESFCSRVDLLPVETADANRLYRAQPIVGFDLDDVGVGVEMDVGRFDNLVSIFGPEASRWTELPHLGGEGARVANKRNATSVAHRPIGGIVLVGTEIENCLGARVKRIEILTTNWPAAVRYPIALLEIDVIVRRAETGPVIGGATEVVERSGLQWKIRLSNNLAAIQILHLLLELESPALEEQNLQRSVGEFAGDGDARRSGANDA